MCASPGDLMQVRLFGGVRIVPDEPPEMIEQLLVVLVRFVEQHLPSGSFAEEVDVDEIACLLAAQEEAVPFMLAAVVELDHGAACAECVSQQPMVVLQERDGVGMSHGRQFSFLLRFSSQAVSIRKQ